MNYHIQIFVGVVAALTVVGVVVSLLRRSRNFKGYEEFQGEFQRIASTLKAEIFRDGDDLGITGNYKRYPVQIRFSYAETAPGVSVRMKAPASFTLSVVPRGERSSEGRVLIRTGDDMFDARFATRTDHPTQARMLVGSARLRAQMEKLCCSNQTFLTLTTGKIELNELTIPSPYTARHVLDHVEQMGALAAGVEAIPGAEKVKIEPYRREQTTPVFRLALLLGAMATLVTVFLIPPTKAQPDLSAGGSEVNYAEGVNSVDALEISDLSGSRAATAEDFDPGIAGWMRGQGAAVSGRVELELDDAKERPDVAYWLLGPDGASRIVILRNGQKLYDTKYANVAGIARVPAASLEAIAWQVRPTEPPQHDGLLILSRTESGVSAVILFAPGSRMLTGVPQQYDTLTLP
jgi:hypothetical protein